MTFGLVEKGEARCSALMTTASQESPTRLQRELATLRGLWNGVEVDLRRMGFTRLADFRGRDASALTRDYCRGSGRPFDPTLQACFAAIVRFAETGEARPWWLFQRADLQAALRAA